MSDMKKEKLLRLSVVSLGVLVSAASFAAEVVVDFGTEVGPVKAVNGVGQPPMVGMPMTSPMFHYLKDAGIPYSRLHDVGGAYGQMRYVDIPNIFKNFDADVDDPKSYDFGFTDVLMKKLVEVGVEPFFRLGITIENPLEWGMGIGCLERVTPPKDFLKWAKICEHVIRHYNEGWANGFHMNVTHWEIWNEPDNRENVLKNPLWRAPFSEYIRFYGVVATYLKGKFPDLKIGGYGGCGFYAAVGSKSVTAAHSDPRSEHFVKCAHAFLAEVKKNAWPLDFFSYHSYSAPEPAMRQVKYADELLNSYGFTADRTERIYNEWLPYVKHENLGTALQAAGIATELVELQNGPCDIACIYDARCGVGNYSPLFNPMTYKPHKAYYAYTSFNELRKLGKAVKVTTDGTRGLHACAAKGKTGAAILFANDTDAGIPVSCDIGGYQVVEVRYTDADHTDAVVGPEDIPSPAVLPPHAFALVILR